MTTIGKEEMARAAATAETVIRLDGEGRYLGDEATINLAHSFMMSRHQVTCAEERMTEAAQALTALRERKLKAERECGRAQLECLPPGWYWDPDEDCRACLVNAKDFCEPTIGNQVRAIGIIPPRVQMAVNTRSMRLRIENGDLSIPDSRPSEWAVEIACERPGTIYATKAEAVEAGVSSRKRFRVGPVERPQPRHFVDTLSGFTHGANSRAREDSWTEPDGPPVFYPANGSEVLLSLTADAIFHTDAWRMSPHAKRYAPGKREPLPETASLRTVE